MSVPLTSMKLYQGKVIEKVVIFFFLIIVSWQKDFATGL